MRAAPVHALLACVLAVAACDREPRGAAAAHIAVFEPDPPGMVDVPALAGRLATETQLDVSLHRVSVLSEDAIRDACARVVAEKPALIVAPAADLVFGLRERTHAIPILFITLTDPIDSSLVSDMQRPRGNVSGYSFNVDIEAKQLEMLKRTFPDVRRAGVLGDRHAFSTSSFRTLAAAARDTLDVELVRVHFQNGEELGPAFERALAAGVDAWLVPHGGTNYRFAQEIVARVRASGRPAIFGHERFVKLGGLMSYSQAFEDPSERVVRMARSVLQGFPVGELPVEQPQNFRFAINTAAWAATLPRPTAKMLLLATDFYDSGEGS
jgi:putative ABC transport system substrate-binding protein